MIADNANASARVAVVVVTHGEAGAAMVASAQKICGPIADLCVVRAETGETTDAVSGRIDAALAGLRYDEVLFLVDLGGSTPARLCCRACGGHSVVLTGLNLAMLFKLATSDRTHGARELATSLAATGTKSIQVLGS